MCRWSQYAVVLASMATAVMLSACASPPNREIADALHALNAARDVRAEQYAPDTYQAAAEAYRQANEAVLAGDYRLALNRALESRDHALSAAREATETYERQRDTARQTMASVTALLVEAAERIEQAERARVPPRVTRDARQVVAQLTNDVQETSAVLNDEDYARAQPVLIAVETRLQAVMVTLNEALAAQTKKPRP